MSDSERALLQLALFLAAGYHVEMFRLPVGLVKVKLFRPGVIEAPIVLGAMEDERFPAQLAARLECARELARLPFPREDLFGGRPSA